MIAVPHETLGIDVDTVREQPANGVEVPHTDRKMQGDGVPPIGADARRIFAQHRPSLAIPTEIDRRQEIEPCAGRQKSGRDRRIGILLHGRRQRGCPGRIGCVRVGAEFEQQLDAREPVSRSRVVQGRAAMMTAGHTRSEQRGLASDNGPHIVDFIERDGTPQIERRSVTEQVLGHVLAHLPEAGRPPKDADLGVVPFAIDVGTRLDQ